MTVVSIHRDNRSISFSKHEANEIVPILLTITRKTKNDVVQLKAKIELIKHDPFQVQELESRIHEMIKKWGEKVSKLGGTPTGLWKVAFPSNEKIPFEWQFPSSHI